MLAPYGSGSSAALETANSTLVRRIPSLFRERVGVRAAPLSAGSAAAADNAVGVMRPTVRVRGGDEVRIPTPAG
ncbi:hypothetical protein Y880_0473401 [Pseudomonas aeruginosa PAK]|nr:hypothetical protein Y880_0473401 [Pseudomonas aeruginosa PAK]